MAPDEPIILPIDGTLDQHCFRPAEVKDLVPDYLQECRKLGILQVRIIHGKEPVRCDAPCMRFSDDWSM